MLAMEHPEMNQSPDLLLGAHMSIAGGVHCAVDRGEALGCTAIQIFTKNASQWHAPPLTEQTVREFKLARSRTGVLVVAHDAYLINLGSPKQGLLQQSVSALTDELNRAETLEVPYLVMHPGAHTGGGEDQGLKSVIDSLNLVFKRTAGFKVAILIENTAGQGTALGHSFDHLRRILHGSVEPDRIGVCLDTCHAFAAGYDLRTRASYEAVFEEFHRKVGMEGLKVLHVNDSRKGLGQKVDRHEHIGKGMLGLDCFRFIMNDPRFRSVPKLMETPKTLGGRDMDPVNLAILRGLVYGPKS
jgi:deoxyribonuclease IV